MVFYYSFVFVFVYVLAFLSTRSYSQLISIPIQDVLPHFTYEESPDEWIHPAYPSEKLKNAIHKWCSQYGEKGKFDACLQITSTKAAVALRESRRQEGALLAQFKGVPTTGQYGLTPNFFQIVSQIYSPEFGTENMAPLLHSLVRFHRPQKIVELGYGYSTPFLAQGLADNVLNSAVESHYGSPSNIAEILHKPWYEKHGIHVGQNISSVKSHLFSIDDSSQREGNGDDGKSYARKIKSVLKKLGLHDLVTVRSRLPLHKAHKNFEDDSIDLIWNDASWSPDFMKNWWPKLRKDGGLLLLHNPIGNGDDEIRWCVASPRRTLDSVIPDAEYEIMTLIEPHKAYQGSVTLIRRLDPKKAPTRYNNMWGYDRADFRGSRFSLYNHVTDALGRGERFRSRSLK